MLKAFLRVNSPWGVAIFSIWCTGRSHVWGDNFVGSVIHLLKNLIQTNQIAHNLQITFVTVVLEPILLENEFLLAARVSLHLRELFFFFHMVHIATNTLQGYHTSWVRFNER